MAKVFQKSGGNCRAELCETVDKLSDIQNTENVQKLMKKFVEKYFDNPNFRLWSTCMGMIEILLDFTRAERDGNWTLHLAAFAAMLPWLTIYDHTNYARWGLVYLADMKLLEKTAPQFVSGNFVVKRTHRGFNQVPSDQATQWMNRMCKMQNAIIGITRNDQARDKFCVTWSERSRISQDTRSLLNQEDDSTWLTSTSCFIISAAFTRILAEVANVLDKDSLHASVSARIFEED